MNPPSPRYAARQPRSTLAVVLVSLLLTAGCSAGGSGAKAATATNPAPAKALRLGYFGNITHAPALVAVARGFLEHELGPTTLKTQVFNAGPAAVEALYAGAIDAAYLGPNPAANAFVKSNGEAVRIISGATSGGAQLVVRPGISSAVDLKGANLASPQLGGTQDIALRSWLTDNGVANSPRGEGDVTITPTENAQTLALFQRGEIDGAWLPEPWASRMVIEAGAKVLVDERTLWQRGEFLTTHLVVSTAFLAKHPQTVEALIRANLASIDWINGHPTDAMQVVNTEIEKAAGEPLTQPVLTRAFGNITVGSEPLAATLPKLVADAVAAGLSRRASLQGIYDLRLLNKVHKQSNLPVAYAAGLGEE